MARRNISSEMKLQIALEAIKEERHTGDIASEHGVHSSTINRWIQELLSSEKQAAKEKEEQEKQIENFYAQIGRLTTQLDWLKIIWSTRCRKTWEACHLKCLWNPEAKKASGKDIF